MAVQDPGANAATMQVARGDAKARREAAALREVRLVAHSNMLYWWIVWAYGYFCALVTQLNHVLVPFGAKQIKFFPEAGLGISYVALVLFVVVFTNVRARVLHTLIIAAIIALVLIGIEWQWGLNSIFRFIPELKVHMNLAFYMVMSTGLLIIWLIVVFGIDHLTYWRFASGQVVETHRLGNAAGNVYDTRGMLMRRQPDDFFRHKFLGLGFLGLGTGDLVFRPSMAGSEPFVIENVWRSNEKQKRIERLLIQSGGNALT